MQENRKGSRVKTEGDRLISEIDRQRSIFNHLSWQDKQRDRKISFLQRYYLQLQQVIKKQKEEDSALHERVKLARLRKRKQHFVYQSSMLKLMRSPESRNRIVTELQQGDESQLISNGAFVDIFDSAKQKNKK